MSKFDANHRHKPRHKDHDDPDPIKDYVEWTEHRYDPGYYVGGRLSPFVRNMQSMWSSREKRVLLALVAVVIIVVAVARWLR